LCLSKGLKPIIGSKLCGETNLEKVQNYYKAIGMPFLETLNNIDFRCRKLPAKMGSLLYQSIPQHEKGQSNSIIELFSSIHLTVGHFEMKSLSFQLIKNVVPFHLAGSLGSLSVSTFPQFG
jgi:hypothetical protein